MAKITNTIVDIDRFDYVKKVSEKYLKGSKKVYSTETIFSDWKNYRGNGFKKLAYGGYIFDMEKILSIKCLYVVPKKCKDKNDIVNAFVVECLRGSVLSGEKMLCCDDAKPEDEITIRIWSTGKQQEEKAQVICPGYMR